MAIIYNSNQVKWGGRGYLDAKMQPVANLAALPNDITEVFEGLSVLVLDDGSGEPHEYWRINGAWVKKDFAEQSDLDDVRTGAFYAATAWTETQGYAKAADVVDTVNDLLTIISTAHTDAIEVAKQYTDEAISAITPSGDVEAERQRAISAETELGNLITQESSRAQSAETTLQGAISAEESRAISAETQLGAAINNETERATSAETALFGLLEDKASVDYVIESVSAETQRAEATYLKEGALSAYSTTQEMEAAIQDAVSAVTGVSSVLTSAITTTVAVGNVPVGTFFPVGTSIEEILRQIFLNGETPTGDTAYGYYGALTAEYAMYDDEYATPEEEFNETNIKARLTRTPEEVTVSTIMDIPVSIGDVEVVFVVPSTLSMLEARDTTNDTPYTGYVKTPVNVTIDGKACKAYYIYVEAGWSQDINIRITLQNA